MKSITYESIKENPSAYIAAIVAVCEGKQIQYRTKYSEEWENVVTGGNFLSDSEVEYRIKPSNSWRPWNPDEIPVGAIIRRKGHNSTRGVILGLGMSDEVLWPDRNGNMMHETCGYCLKENEYSTDLGKTWKPCGVLE